MKRLKQILSISALMLVVAFIAGGFTSDAATAEKGVNVISDNIHYAAAAVTAGDLKNVKYEKFILKKFRHVGRWIGEVTSKQSWVNNDVIKIPKRGGTAPKVLINNTVYPIVSNRREDKHVVVSLNKYDTENRTVTDDELYAIAYDKEGDVNLELKEELEETTVNHALHSISPSAPSADVPVLVTTGEADGARKRLTKKDVIRLKGELDNRKVPKDGRVLVLNAQHANDLILEDAVFERGYHNRTSGDVTMKYYGFKIYEETYTPQYVAATKAIIPFGSATEGKTSSIVFHKKSTCKAIGTVKRYARKSSENPEGREAKLGYRLWFGCFAIQDAGQAAIIDG